MFSFKTVTFRFKLKMIKIANEKCIKQIPYFLIEKMEWKKLSLLNCLYTDHMIIAFPTYEHAENY